MKIVIRLFPAVFCLLLAFPVAAAGPTVAFQPSPVAAPVGQTVPVAVTIADVQGLYGFEMQLRFDPAVVEVVDADPNTPGVQMLPGDFLALDFLVRNTADNVAGVAEFVLTQINPSEAKSGAGVLFTLYVKGKAAGQSSAVEIVKSQFASRDGVAIDVAVTNGVVRVAAAAVATPVASPTPLPTVAAPRIDLTAVATSRPPVAPASTATRGSPVATTDAVATPPAAATPAPAQTGVAPVVTESPATAPVATAPVTTAPVTTEPPATGAPTRASEPTAASGVTPEATPEATLQAVEAASGAASAPVLGQNAAPTEVSAAQTPARSNTPLWIGGGLLVLAAAGLVALAVIRRGN